MAILNPHHLFDQAERLILPIGAGPPRQVDLRRAVSNAYYGVFHFTVTSAANEFIGKSYQSTSNYTLVYRSLDHRWFRDFCLEVKKPNLPAKYAKYQPDRGFADNIQAFATAVVELQEKRHLADYDPSLRIKTSDARLAIATARSAIKRFGRATAARRKAFLTLLLFPPR